MNLTNTLKEALYSIRMLKQELLVLQETKTDPIAIIGIGCRFPTVKDKESFWQLMVNQKNIISPIPDERWELLAGTDEEIIKVTAKNCRGGFLSNIDEFDPGFFGITPREATYIDPQQRLLLEVTYEALEDAGLPVERLAGSNTGIFASLYGTPLPHLQKNNLEDALYIATGSAVSMAANRLSYFLDLHGPSIVYDTACSSSLVATYSACMHLQKKTCDLAIVCGVNINLLPSTHLLLSHAKMLSPNGQCKTFDALANGYVQGEGVGVIVLKPLSQALENKDRIYAVILGGAINQDGKTNGLTAPNGLQQESLIRTAYKNANINPSEICYVECHGTGTYLGDPIEVQALGEVLGHERSPDIPCWIGSLKTNLGHLEPAAGIASIIKVALALQHKKIPPHLNFETPNPYIAFDKYHFRIPQKLQPWPSYGSHRMAGVSGFGFGGTNAHLVLREFDTEYEDSLTEDRDQLFTLSTKDLNSLKSLLHAWKEFLEQKSSYSLQKICYNLQSRRSHFWYRIAIIAKDANELLSAIIEIQQCPLEQMANSKRVFINLSNEKKSNEGYSSLEKMAIDYINRQTIDWKIIHGDKTFSYLDMPKYPWQHQRYWPNLKKTSLSSRLSYPFYKNKIESPLLQFEFRFNSQVMPELKDTFHFLHVGYYLEMLAYVTKHFYKQNYFSINDLEFKTPIIVPNKEELTTQLIFEKQDETWLFNLYSLSHDDQWISHSTGLLNLHSIELNTINIDRIKAICTNAGTDEDFKTRVKAMNMPISGSIDWIKQFWRNDNEIICELMSPVEKEKHDFYDLNIHLGVVDSAIQSLFMILPADYLNPYIATHIQHCHVNLNTPKFPLFLYAKLQTIDNNQYTGHIHLLNADGEVILQFENVLMTQLNKNMRLDSINKESSAKSDFQSLTYEQQKSFSINYLMDKIAILFSMPKKNIELNKPLADMGMDSLMAIGVIQAIDEQFSVNFSLQDILQGMTLMDIVKHLLIKSKPRSNPWINYQNSRQSPKIRLFCFPYGGAGASVYGDWQTFFPDYIEVCPIQYPGREERINENSYADLNKLIEALCVNLKDEMDIPFVFFGHSMGALIAFELTRALRAQNQTLPQRLILSAFPEPRKPTKGIAKVINELNQIDPNWSCLSQSYSLSSLSENLFNKIVDVLKENGLVDRQAKNNVMKHLLPIFVNDINIIKNYHYTEQDLLDIPFTLFIGKNDHWLDREDQIGWCTLTNNVSDIYELNGGHLFIKEENVKKEVCDIITAILFALISHSEQDETVL